MPLPDIDTIATLGGVLTNDSPVVNPTTDLDADADTKSRANVAMMTHTLARAIRRFAGHATTPTDPSSGFVHDATWGNTPALKPPVTKGGTGIFDITWPATVTDELGVAHTTNLRGGWGNVEATGNCYVTSVQVLAPNVLRVRVWQQASSLNDAAGLNVTVYAY